jgi:ribosome biogenesis GTPase
MRATSKHNSRPRSKIRPPNQGAIQGMVINSARGRYRVVVALGDKTTELLVARARKLTTTDIVPGDVVEIDAAALKSSASSHTLADSFSGGELCGRIVNIIPQKNKLVRTADDAKTAVKVIAANLDYCAICVATTSPAPHPEFIRRVVIACESEGITPLLVITKSDLRAFDSSILPDIAKEIEVFDIQKNFNALLSRLRAEGGTTTGVPGMRKITAFVGISGVGKSTLLNRIIPTAERRTCEVSQNGDGKHTSTSSEAFEFAPDSWIIDTPGIRSFGLGHLRSSGGISAD